MVKVIWMVNYNNLEYWAGIAREKSCPSRLGTPGHRVIGSWSMSRSQPCVSLASVPLPPVNRPDRCWGQLVASGEC